MEEERKKKKRRVKKKDVDPHPCRHGKRSKSAIP